MPSLEACEPWVFRRNLLLSVCPVELFPTHQLLLSAEGNTLMLWGPFGCTATAVCVLCSNSLPNTECASCGLGLFAMCVCWGDGIGKAKEAAGASVVWSARDASSPGQAQTQPDSAPPVPAADCVWLLVEHRAWREGNTQVGFRQQISPQTGLIL